MIEVKEFFTAAKTYLDKARVSQRENIEAAAKLMGDCMDENGIVQLFGLDHGRAFSMELGYRAGGLMPFHQFNTKDLALRGVISETELNNENFNDDIEVAQKLWNLYQIESTDMFILISNGGNEGLLVETALMAKAKGHKVIAVVSKSLSEVVASKHPSGKKITDVADLVIDNCADCVDAILDVDSIHKMNQVSTIVGNVIAQMLTAETYRYLTNKGLDCPVLLSANVSGADVHNKELSDKYIGRWNS